MGSIVEQKNVQKSCCINTCLDLVIVLCLLLVLQVAGGGQQQSCDKSRKVFTTSWGVISDSDGTTNYTKDSHCEWLIRSKNASQFITLTFHSLFTECAYDYIFVYDGDSYQSPLLGSFSGKTEPQQIVATSGSMLILLYSDTNYVLDGFKAEFSITNCPNNCTDNGKCINHQCVCSGNWIGIDCGKDACPENCNSYQGFGICHEERCICSQGYTGQSCSLKQKSPIGNEYHWLSDKYDGFEARAGHTAVYNQKTDALYVFGGYDLNRIMGSMQVYRFGKNVWENEFGMEIQSRYKSGQKIDSTLLKAVLYEDDSSVWGLTKDRSLFKNLLLSMSENKQSVRRARSTTTIGNLTEEEKIEEILANSRPKSRYGHAAARVEDGFVIYGGKLENGELADDLWLYNVSDESSIKWKLRAINSKFKPPGLTRHTLTLTGDYLYLFGGSTINGDFSSRMFKIKLNNDDPSQDQWEEVKCKGGKPLDVRVVAHTTVYYAPINSLIIYGGITTGVARFSKLSDRMFAFNLDTQYWTEILYPRANLPDSYIPRERAFHTSIVSGNYLIVFGGYSHRHNKEEICYDNQMYLYHLGCNIWVHQDVLGYSTNSSRYPKQQGVFAHASTLRQNTLLLIGGYHGNVNADLLAYTIPPMIHENEDPESKCQNYQQNECLSNPDCGWCSADTLCYGRTVGANCTTNLQTARCPGICQSLGDCHSCLIFGKSRDVKNHNSVAKKLGLDKCTWCVQNARCHHKDEYGLCGEDTPSQDVGWWGKTGIEITQPEFCSHLDKRPGLTLLRYLNPVDFNMPDSISIINATMVDFNMPTMTTQTEQTLTGEIVTRLLGFIRPPETWKGAGERLMVYSSHSQSELKIGFWGQNIKLAANITSDQTTCTQAKWSALEPGKIYVDLLARRSSRNVNQYSKIGLQHNRTTDNVKAFTFEYLEPFSNGTSCSSYTSCLQCLSDAACGYCELTEKCVSRELNETQSCSNNEEWNYLILHPPKCKNCSNFISCEECVNTTNNCEWWIEDNRCNRRGRSPKAAVSLKECPIPCYQRNECSSCLNEPGRCVWCKATSTCFSFSVYTSEFQFGSCREWLDQATPFVLTTSENWHHVDDSQTNIKCRSCSSYANCSSCLQTLNCGWCFDRENPIEGICMHGDFNSSALECSAVLNRTEVEFAYAQCPDVDECGLGLHDCHKEAKCTNTHGSYTCQCRKGFIGDGKTNCTKTCYENCIHGTCSGQPNYKCNCDLGWTGADCSINCGCHNHSTCESGIGICNYCQDYTEGIYCERCRPGSYGNATNGDGCKRCDCNEHGNETLGICDSTTGECFCKDNTEGLHCEMCNKNYYGDPKDGGQCYFQCEPRGVLKGEEKQGLGSYQSYRPPWGGPETRECLWIISPLGSSNNTGDSIIRLEIEPFESNISCSRNAIYIYDGLPDLTGVAQQKQLLGVYCSEDQFPKSIEAKTGHMTIFYKQSVVGQGFNAMYNVESCKLGTCKLPYSCDSNGRCACPERFTGAKCNVEQCPDSCNSDLSQGVCDMNYGRCLCNSGYGNRSCSREIRDFNLVFTELFNSQDLSDTLDHLRKTIPRFGHTLVCDRRGSLWMFGGYSLSHGALNDIRQFDTKNSTWLQVTIEGLTMPAGRYFHSAEFISGKQAIYIFGGMTGVKKNSTEGVLDDFWRFNLQGQRWEIVDVKGTKKPRPLAGHTLTLVKESDKDYLIVIGGLSFEHGLNNNVWMFNLSDNTWQIIDCKGSAPNGIFGHSTVYHSISQSLYIYGGYIYEENKTVISNKLFSLKLTSNIWSELPIFDELNRPSESLPRGRFGHSAVTTDNYMVVYGGRTSPHNASDVLIAYVYQCNQWIRLTEDVDFIGDLPTITYAQAMALDVDSGSIYVVGGWDGSSTGRVVRINIPSDLCSLWSRSKYMCRHYMGCSFCAVKPFEEFGSHCYSGLKHTCDDKNGTLILNSGQQCDIEWISRRNCSSFPSCSSCLAIWPAHPDVNQTCQWMLETNKCVTIATTNCTETDTEKCLIEEIINTAGECPSSQCIANDCRSCNEMQSCVWTFNGQVHQCMSDLLVEKKKVDIIKACPEQCSSHKNCSSCLRALSSEGGLDECHWSTQLGICISPSYQPLLCSGGICGLILTPDEKDYCPEPCETFDQCQSCLRHAHCGFCSKLGTEGEGVCTEGSMVDHPARSTCHILYANAKNATLAETDRFSWNYVKCPPENECINDHHNCDDKSEKCYDLNFGYECRCADGYKLDAGKCIPVCENGCVRGACKEPNKCFCDFGYVGENCSIQCQCNGNANCEGPDKLDVCGECYNHTMGPQCEKCAKWYVKHNKTGECIPCHQFCNGHTDICVAKEMVEVVKNLSKIEIDTYFTEGVPSEEAVCLGCQNFTDGEQCDTCLVGYFRGTTLATDPCRECECHGHGSICDPVTGEKCDCKNNTESDPTCSAKSMKNSVFPCWNVQCSKCRDSYAGRPTEGHQCYKQITVESKMCFDAHSIDECKVKPKPLHPGQTVFFVVQPRFMNVDIRIIVDVTQGELDLFMSPQDDSFVVEPNRTNGFHEIYLDHNYRWATVKKDETDLFQPLMLSPEKNKYRNLTDDDKHFYSPAPDCKTKSDGFYIIDQIAKEFCTYITLLQCNTLLRVFGLKNRLVITLPQTAHNLSGTRFFIALRATSGGNGASYGLIFFRQDQLHIDLFVFFSVFFSCFFLFLAMCVIAWKFKQAADLRRTRRRHHIELRHMAKRPVACIDLYMGPESHTPSHRRHKSRTSQVRQGPHMIAQEITADNCAAVATVFVRLPGRQKAPINLSMGSALVSLSTRKRRHLQAPSQQPPPPPPQAQNN